MPEFGKPLIDRDHRFASLQRTLPVALHKSLQFLSVSGVTFFKRVEPGGHSASDLNVEPLAGEGVGGTPRTDTTDTAPVAGNFSFKN